MNINYWTLKTFEVSSVDKISNRYNLKTNYNGLDLTGRCKYTFNELGFRGDSIYKEGFKIMSIGCSNTEGVGVNDEETWSYIFSRKFSNGVNCNFAFGGRSNDYISRCLITYYDLVKPDLVLIMYTEPHRRDFFTENGDIEPFHFNGWGYFSTENGKEDLKSLIQISNKENDFQNWYKNHLLIKYFLETKKCNWLWNGWYVNTDFSDIYRYDGDFYPFIDYGVDNYHPGPKTHFEYSQKLYDYINHNFPNYLK